MCPTTVSLVVAWVNEIGAHASSVHLIRNDRRSLAKRNPMEFAEPHQYIQVLAEKLTDSHPRIRAHLTKTVALRPKFVRAVRAPALEAYGGPARSTATARTSTRRTTTSPAPSAPAPATATRSPRRTSTPAPPRPGRPGCVGCRPPPCAAQNFCIQNAKRAHFS